jgi:2-amino-4-hydroxy-6-hydroxymethyldihydropteridine diphosphokinase
VAERVFVGLGANLGDASATLHAALAALRELPGVQLMATSSFYASKPVDATGPDYVNAVAEIHTRLTPQDLLLALHQIESRFGRKRPFANAPRTLDLDLLLYGQQVISTPTLTVPHPRMHERAFVILPLLELAPTFVHPQLGALAAQLPAVSAQDIHRVP